MSWPESSSWVLEGKEAADFLNRIFEDKPRGELLKSTEHSIEQLLKLAEEYVEPAEK